MLNEIKNNVASPLEVGDGLRGSWVEVDLLRLRNNFYAIRNSLRPGTKIMAVVKADAYGHGALTCARTFENAGADYFGVATVREGIELRETDIKKPILILSQPPASAIPTLLDYEIMPSVFDSEFAVQYGEVAATRDTKAPFHLAINTGMNRIGVSWNEAAEFAKMISFHSALELTGTFTHFATADEIDTLDFEKQAIRFETAINEMKAIGVNPGIVHCSNSAATLKYPGVHLDMVRPGIILYGLKPSPVTIPQIDLKPAMSVKAVVTDVRSVPIGEGVSYGLRYRSRGYAKVCTISVGYADGLHRACSGKINFLFHGEKVRQIGSVCMDQCMFEVPQRHLSSSAFSFEPKPGEVVTLIGEEGDQAVTLDDMALACETINYELACDFGAMRLNRVYV